MKVSKLGILAASAVASLLGTATFAADGTDGSKDGDKACYRPSCATSVKGHEGKCSGTRIDELKDEVAVAGRRRRVDDRRRSQEVHDHDS
jgi:hypothetical protein